MASNCLNCVRMDKTSALMDSCSPGLGMQKQRLLSHFPIASPYAAEGEWVENANGAEQMLQFPSFGGFVADLSRSLGA